MNNESTSLYLGTEVLKCLAFFFSWKHLKSSLLETLEIPLLCNQNKSSHHLCTIIHRKYLHTPSVFRIKNSKKKKKFSAWICWPEYHIFTLNSMTIDLKIMFITLTFGNRILYLRGSVITWSHLYINISSKK